MASSSEEYLDSLLASANQKEQGNNDTFTNQELNNEELRSDNTESPILEEEFLDPEELDFLNLPEKSDLFPDRAKTPGFDGENPFSDDVDMPFSALPDVSQMEDFAEQNPYGNLGLDADMLMDLEDVDSLLADAEKIAQNTDVSPELEDLSNTDFSSEMVLDADLAEINSILEKSDNNEVVEDSLLSMLDDIKESDTEKGLFDNSAVLEEAGENDSDSSEKDRKVKKKKKPKKEKKEKKENKKNTSAGQDEDVSGQSLLNVEKAEGETDDKKNGEKKPGLLDRIKEFVFAPDEEEDSDHKEKTQKSSKDSSKKKETDKKEKSPDENELLEKELEAEDIKDLQNKKKKEKKEKKQPAKKEKPAKPKKERRKAKVEEEDNKKGKTIGPVGTFITLLCCFTLLAVILILCYVVPNQLALAKGRIHYYRGDYVSASTILYGHKLGKSDKLLLQKSVLLGDLELRLKKYESFCELNEQREALNALFEAKSACMDADFEANELGITEEVGIIEDQIDELLIVKYQLKKEEIDEICKMKSLYYTIAIDNLLAGKPYNELPAELKRPALDSTDEEQIEEDSEFREPDIGNENEEEFVEIENGNDEESAETENGNDEELEDPLPEE